MSNSSDPTQVMKKFNLKEIFI